MEKPSIGRLVSSIYRCQVSIINKRFDKYGIGSGQYIFLIHIAKNPGINQKDLSEKIKIDRANTHRAIRKLESLGYIYTYRDEEDRRNIKSFLTERGQDLMPVIKSELMGITDIMVGDFDDGEREVIFRLLERIEQNVQDHVKLLRKGRPNAQS